MTDEWTISAVPKTYLTPAEYLASERRSDIKHEYFRGELFAKARSSRQHARIAANLAYLLVGQMKDYPCEVFSGNMRVKISPTGLCTYPDASVVCGRSRFEV